MKSIDQKIITDVVKDLQKLESEFFKRLKDDPEKLRNNWKKLSNYSKRFANMIISDGVLRSFLFAFSKAKVSRVQKYFDKESLSYGELLLDANNNISEGEGWAFILSLILKYALNRNKFDSNEFINLLNDFARREMNGLAVLEKRLIRYLEFISRIFESLSRV